MDSATHYQQQQVSFVPLDQRIWAVAIDLLFIIASISLLSNILGVISSLLPDIKLLDSIVITVNSTFKFVLPHLYMIFAVASPYQGSVGKYILGMRIVNEEGESITLVQSLCRYLSQYLSVFVFFLGFFLIKISLKRQALHDLIARTYVVREEEKNWLEVVKPTAVIFAVFIFSLCIAPFAKDYGAGPEKRELVKGHLPKSGKTWVRHAFDQRNHSLYLPDNWSAATSFHYQKYLASLNKYDKSQLQLAFKPPAKWAQSVQFVGVEKVINRKAFAKDWFFEKHIRLAPQDQQEIIERLTVGKVYRKSRNRKKATLHKLYDSTTNLWWESKGIKDQKYVSAYVETTTGLIKVTTILDSDVLDQFLPTFIKIAESLQVDPQYEIYSDEI